MITKKFSNALGNISEIYIDEAVTYTAKKKSRLWAKWGSIAACIAIMLTSVLIIIPTVFSGNEKYYDYGINEGIFSAYIGGNVIDEEKIGSKIENVNVTAGWKSKSGRWLNKENLNAEVYAIKGVESDVAVALRFIDNGEAVTTDHYYVVMHPNAEYNGKIFPDYKAENPVRYLDMTDMGESNGWQDFGINGEIRTITVPIGSTYVYQMYSYYIRNDLTHIYADEELPDSLYELPEWLSDTVTVGRRSFWYSMGGRIPENISVEATTKVMSENSEMHFIKAEYKIQIKDGSNEKKENWVIYFMEEDGVYSAYAVVVNENIDFVKAYTEAIVKSYQIKK